MTTEKKAPESFYYLSSLNNDDRRNWLKEILLENKIYFRQREQLNDPNELRPSLIFDGSDKQIRNYVRKNILNYSPIKFSPAKRLLEENKQIHILRNSPHVVEMLLHETLDKVGIFSLTETPAEPLLWAHYADGHRGIAIEFDANSGFFLAAQKVTYTNDAPVVNRLIDTTDQLLNKSMFTKSLHWSYEREWRVMARWQDEARLNRYLLQNTLPMQLESFIHNLHGPGMYDFPPSAIKSVILGDRISDETRDWLNSIVNHASQSIQIKRARLDKQGNITVI